jgi:hypothetical protein
MSKKQLCDLELHLHAETNKAILVSNYGVAENAVWVPKSQCEFEIKNNLVEVTMPEWLAIDKGLV